MKKALFLSLAVVILFPALSTAGCLDTKYYGPHLWDAGETALTAAIVDPTGPVTGVVNAAGCDIGVFYNHPTRRGLVQNAKIYGARRFGVVVYANTSDVAVDIVSSSIYDIGTMGAMPDDLYGMAVLYDAPYGGVAAKGKITGNSISRYQFAGVYAFGGVELQITDNIICGKHIAGMVQNGIQLDFALGRIAIERNTITNNLYTGADAGLPWFGQSAGIAVYYAPAAKISENVLVNNQYGLYIIGVDGGGETSSPTQVAIISNNRIMCDDVYVVRGAGQSQIGILGGGLAGKLSSNEVTGKGYVVQ